MRVCNRHVLHVTIFDIRDARRPLDHGLIALIDAQTANDGKIRRVVCVEVMPARDAHIRARYVEAHEGEGTKGHEQHDRHEAPA